MSRWWTTMGLFAFRVAAGADPEAMAIEEPRDGGAFVGDTFPVAALPVVVEVPLGDGARSEVDPAATPGGGAGPVSPSEAPTLASTPPEPPPPAAVAATPEAVVEPVPAVVTALAAESPASATLESDPEPAPAVSAAQPPLPPPPAAPAAPAAPAETLAVSAAQPPPPAAPAPSASSTPAGADSASEPTNLWVMLAGPRRASPPADDEPGDAVERRRDEDDEPSRRGQQHTLFGDRDRGSAFGVFAGAGASPVGRLSPWFDAGVVLGGTLQLGVALDPRLAPRGGWLVGLTPRSAAMVHPRFDLLVTSGLVWEDDEVVGARTSVGVRGGVEVNVSRSLRASGVLSLAPEPAAPVGIGVGLRAGSF
jgi:hypothetical protein